MADKPSRRILGLTLDGRPLFEPQANASSIVYAAMGGGKTTCVAVPTLMSQIADRDQAVIINDVKDGEIAAQTADMCRKYGRKFAVVDDFNVLGGNNPHKISLNAFGAAQAGAEAASIDLPFTIEGSMLALIEEPPNDQRNFYWRESPRSFLETVQNILLSHTPRLATPGGLAAFLSDPALLTQALEAESEEERSPHRHAAAQILEMKACNPEHYAQHLRAALSAVKIFSVPPLSEAGRVTDMTHARLLREKYIVCLVNPVRHADRLGSYYALHALSFMHAQLTGAAGRTCMILDEYCNAPLKEVINRVTVFRAYGLKCLFITQSRMDSVRKYGERETAILEENCTVKQWLKFSNFEEAERVSHAMGEAVHVSKSISLNSDRLAFSESMNLTKERLMTAAELMSLPDDEQIIHIAGVGFIRAKKIRQNEIAPYCFDLADNPLEGGRLPPNPKVRFATPETNRTDRRKTRETVR
jgi:type IV secretion system protein VirD4